MCMTTAAAIPRSFPISRNPLQALGRLSELQRLSFAADDSNTMQRGIQLAEVAGDPIAAARAFRGIVVHARALNTGPLAFGLPEPMVGGLLQLQRRHAGNRNGMESIEPINVNDSGGVQNVLNMFEALSPAENILADSLSQMLAHAVAKNPQAGQSILDYLDRANRRSAITANDRILISRLAMLPQTKVTPSLLGELYDGTINTFSPLRSTLETSLATQGQRGTAAVRNWIASFAYVGIGRMTESWSIDPEHASNFVMPDVSANAASTQPIIAAAPRPGDEIDDLKESERLITLLETGRLDAAKNEIDALHNAARISVEASPQTMLVSARIAADQGNVASFSSQLAAVMKRWQWHGGAPLLDIRSALPGSRESDDHSASTGVVSQAIINVVDQLAERWPGDIDLCEQLCVVGSWCVDRSDAVSAQHLLQTAIQASQRIGDGPQQLWVADLADRAAQSEIGSQILQKLLEEHRLSPARIPSVLHYFSSKGDDATASKLAMEASKYASVTATSSGRFPDAAAPTTTPSTTP